MQRVSARWKLATVLPRERGRERKRAQRERMRTAANKCIAVVDGSRLLCEGPSHIECCHAPLLFNTHKKVFVYIPWPALHKHCTYLSEPFSVQTVTCKVYIKGIVGHHVCKNLISLPRRQQFQSTLMKLSRRRCAKHASMLSRNAFRQMDMALAGPKNGGKAKCTRSVAI